MTPDHDALRRFNQKRLEDRNLDTLIGLAKGLVADGVINQQECEFLRNWLGRAQAEAPSPLTNDLLRQVDRFLADGRLDEGEAEELLSTLRRTVGEESAEGEERKPSQLPLNEPAPHVRPVRNLFLFTGTFTFGTRKQCHSAVEGRGGLVAEQVTKSLNFLVIGSYVSEFWAHESYGRKIEKAMEYRAKGLPLAIISEQHWIEQCELGDVYGERPALRLVKP
jgi:hypothetical protein